VTLAAFLGFNYGLARFSGSIAALVAAFWFAPQLGIAYEGQVAESLQTTGLLNRFLCVGVIGFLIFMLGGWIVTKILVMLAEVGPRVSKTNSWLGFVAGGFQAAAAILLLLGGLFVMEPMVTQRSNAESLAEATIGKRFADKALRTTELTRQSLLAPVITAYNPFTRFPELNKFEQVQKSVAVLSSPGRINELLQHPAIRQLQGLPEIEQAYEELMADGDLKDVLKSGKEMDTSTAFKLLKHPAILRLVDHPKFMEEATRIINETNLVSQL
jgi:uncharacterized membrane protein required for colicin V production